MNERRTPGTTHRAQDTRIDPLRSAVRRAVRLSAGVIAAGLITGTAAAAPRASFPAVLPLASLLPGGGGDGSAGFVLGGAHALEDSGISVSAVGDLNDDGLDDLVIGAMLASPGGRTNAGESYVVFGRDTGRVGNFPAFFPLESLLPAGGGDGSVGFVLTGIDASDLSGRPVSAAGDVNGDGIDDLLIGADGGAPGGRMFAGESYVVFGRDAAQAGNFPAVFPLASLLPSRGGDGSKGFVLAGIDMRDISGYSVSAAGDLNGDGIDDLIIGASAASPGGRQSAGESYVVFGRDTAQAGNFPAAFQLASLLPSRGGDGSAGFVLAGIDAGDDSGISVSAAGDVNADGIDDLVIGAFVASPGGRTYAGESYVVFGRDTAQVGNFPAVFQLARLLPADGGDGSAGFVLTGIDSHDRSGISVSDAGDVNGDGIDDLLVGADGAAPDGRTDAGESYVVFGRNPADDGNFPAVFPLAHLLPGDGGDGSAGFVLTGIDFGDESSDPVSAAGDLNGDGIDDLVIGATGADPDGEYGAGESYVVFGRDTAQAGNFPAVFPLANLLPTGGGDGSAGFVLTGIDSADSSGFSASASGDLNGDGLDDLVIGAPSARSPGGPYGAGESYVVFGRASLYRDNENRVLGNVSAARR
jgi:hypothetical protein